MKPPIELNRPTILNIIAIVSYCLATMFHIIAYATDNWASMMLDNVRWRFGLWQGCREEDEHCTTDIFQHKVFQTGSDWHTGAQVMMTLTLIILFFLEFTLIGYACIKNLEKYRSQLVGTTIALSLSAAFCHFLVLIMYGTEVDKISESYVKASYGILVISLLIEVILPVIVYVDKSRAFPSGRIFKIPRRVIGIGKSGDPQQGNSRRGVVRDEREVYTIESSNSLRTSMTSLSEATSFFGCVNKDKYGSILEEKACDMGVNMQLQYTTKEPTGTCAVIVTGENRSLCANLAAANCFTEDHLDDKANWQLVEDADFFYCAGFPLTVSPSTMLRLAKHSHSSGKTFCMNLSAPFLCQFFKDPMLELFPFVDVLFGNETEATTFAEQNGFETTKIPDIAKKIATVQKENTSKSRMVVITQGDLPVVVAYDDKVEEFPVIPIDTKDIVDTNGAGDAFVGGFLAYYVQGQPLKECVRCGNYAANLVIQRSGCTVPEKPNFV